jgi:hypothetical protein
MRTTCRGPNGCALGPKQRHVVRTRRRNATTIDAVKAVRRTPASSSANGVVRAVVNSSATVPSATTTAAATG